MDIFNYGIVSQLTVASGNPVPDSSKGSAVVMEQVDMRLINSDGYVWIEEVVEMPSCKVQILAHSIGLNNANCLA